jgi:hypothetical protein
MPLFEGTPRAFHWRTSPAPINAGQGTSNGTFIVAPVDADGDAVHGVIEMNTVAFAMSYNWTNTSVSQAFSSTYRVGLYTRSGSTLNLVNSASGTFGATAANNSNSASFQGVRFVTINSSQWSSKPYLEQDIRYHIAIQLLSHVTTTAMSWMNAATAATAFSRTMYGAGAPNASHQPHAPFRGIFNATTTAVPSTIQASQLTGTGANGSVFPWLRIDANYNVY